MKKKSYFCTIGIPIFCTLLFFGCSRERPLSEKGGIWTVYEKECQECHKADGRSSLIGRWFFKAPDFTDTKWQDNASDSRLIIAVANGKRKMPGFKGKLKDEEIVDLVKVCVRSYYPPEE
ncbi:MAG: cytochrome c [wastewater metagenome]|nr:cytochrome c [Candidatus Loosdrechtia aerotolerans]